MDTEICVNCGRVIGNLETRYLFNGNVVCRECDGKLRAPKPVTASRTMPVHISDTKRVNALGVASLVLGIIACLLCWIPFVGCLTVPVAALGALFGLIGILASLVGRQSGIGFPIAGTVVCCAAIAVAVASTGATSAAIGEAVNTVGSGLQPAEYTAPPSANRQEDRDLPADAAREQKREYAQQIEIYDFTAAYFESFTGRTAGVKFKVRNNGDRTLTKIRVTVYFKDGRGNIIGEDDFCPVLTSSYSSDFNKPLRPGYIWQMPQGNFLPAESVPDEWQEGSVAVKLTDFEFED